MGGGYERMEEPGFSQGPSPYGAARNNYGGGPPHPNMPYMAALTIIRR